VSQYFTIVKIIHKFEITPEYVELSRTFFKIISDYFPVPLAFKMGKFFSLKEEVIYCVLFQLPSSAYKKIGINYN